MLPIMARVAAATAPAGYDLLQNDRQNVSNENRVLTHIAVVGGAAIADTAVDVYIGNFYLGRYYNKRAGVVVPVFPDDYIPVGNRLIPAGAKLAAVVFAQGGTNPTHIELR